jgi:peptidyl-prolyl cis-trans isomerase D
MLDYLRQGAQNKFAKIILALITVPFALWGVESYIRNGVSTDSVATVAGQKISSQEFNQAVRDNLAQLRAQYGNNFDPAFADNPEFRQMVLNGLIDQRLLLAEAQRAGISVSDKLLAERIAAIPAFQEEGKFSKTRYEGLLRQQGMTPVGFEARLRQDIVLQGYQQAVTSTPLVSRTTVDTLIRLSEQTREVSVANYAPEQFMAQVKIDDAAIKSYYDGHKQEFTVPDQVKVEYVLLSGPELAQQMTVSDDEVKRYYDEHASQYKQAEERQASHILISAPASASDADKKAALAKAEDVLKQAKQSPQQFAALAEKYSQDTGSASKGGDLGFFGRGLMVKPFEDAAFQMTDGEIRGPVQSEFGYHIIKLTGVKPEKGKTLGEATPDIVAEIKKQKAAKRFSEIAEPFSNTVYEQSASLKPAAEAYKLAIKQSPWLSRQGVTVPELSNEKLLAAVFSDEVLKNKRNTEAVEVAPNTLVAARLLEFKPSALRPLSEVSADIGKRLAQQEASKLAAGQGKEALEQITKSGTSSGVNWSTPTQVSRQQPGALGPEAIDMVFKADAKTLPRYVGVENPQGGYSIVKISKVTDGTPTDEAKKRMFTDRLKSIAAQSEFTALLTSLRQSAEVKVKKDLLEKKEQP